MSQSMWAQSSPSALSSPTSSKGTKGLQDVFKEYHPPNGRMWAPHFPVYGRSGNGFPNDGTSDYRNVIFQMLMHCPPFINWLENYMLEHIGVNQDDLLPESQSQVGLIPIDDLICRTRGEECYLCSIWTIYATYWTERPSKDPWFMNEDLSEDHYRTLFNNMWDRIFAEWSETEDHVDGQQDPAEFWPVLVNILRAEIDPQSLKAINQFDRIFDLPMLSKCACQGSGACSEPHYVEHQESMLRVDFPLHSNKAGYKFSVQGALNEFFSRKIEVTGKCEACKNRGQQTEVIAFPPEVLFVQVNRMIQDNDEPKKSLRQIQLVEKLEFDVEHFDPRLNLTTENARCHYELFWVAMHRGESLQEGHYDCYAKGRKQWSMFDDDQSWPIDKYEDFAHTRDAEQQAYILGYRRYIPENRQSHPTIVFNPDGMREDPMDLDVPETENLTEEEKQEREMLNLSHWTAQDFERAKRLMITFTDVDGSFTRSVDLVGFAIDPLKKRAMHLIGFPSSTTGTLELTLFDRDNHIIESCSMDGYLKDEGTEKRRRDHIRAGIIADRKRRLGLMTPDEKSNVKKPANNRPLGMRTLADPSQTRPFDIKDIILAHRPKTEAQQREQMEKEKQEKEEKEKKEKEGKEKEDKKKEGEAKTGKESRRSSLKQSADKLKDKIREVLKPKDSGVKKNGKEKKDKKDKKKNKKKHKKKNGKKSKDGDSSSHSEMSEG
ncbi:uncharacterized protein N7483_007879 [Penicillium malachiteum]|uniref:uncharacterized protein n=1 Tax=Penicillium malachiteum TaxID=1324776 RepID=UPI00254856F1|nr:uncharacterized protein N7483_007879 [Penicillium malachiteum]KAJ5726522.1 hypothetical protein N7483_007879 [Penicillium malachiteum]